MLKNLGLVLKILTQNCHLLCLLNDVILLIENHPVSDYCKTLAKARPKWTYVCICVHKILN